MKKNNLLILSLVFSGSSLLLIMCSKKDKTDPVPSGKMDVTMTGGDFIASTKFEFQGAAQIIDNQTIITGTTYGFSLWIIVSNSSVAGNYEVKGSSSISTTSAEIGYKSGNTRYYSSVLSNTNETLGSVTITEVDKPNKTISGTFTSTVFYQDGITPVNLTAGSFNKVPYSDSQPNKLTTKINGTPFSADLITSDLGGPSLRIFCQKETNTGIDVVYIGCSSSITPGTYEVGDSFPNQSVVYTTFGKIDEEYLPKKGTLTITKHDTFLKRIEGTFNLTTTGDQFNSTIGDSTDGPTITEGAFAVTYQ